MVMRRRTALSTKDNPFNPLTEFDHWYAFDLAQGRDTCGYQARIVVTSDELSPAYHDMAVEDGIDEILEMNPESDYIKVVEVSDEPF